VDQNPESTDCTTAEVLFAMLAGSPLVRTSTGILGLYRKVPSTLTSERAPGGNGSLTATSTVTVLFCTDGDGIGGADGIVKALGVLRGDARDHHRIGEDEKHFDKRGPENIGRSEFLFLARRDLRFAAGSLHAR